jgi:hypothetical protein
MNRLKCLLGRHDWHSEYDHEAQRVTWSCRGCTASGCPLPRSSLIRNGDPARISNRPLGIGGPTGSAMGGIHEPAGTWGTTPA